jgi:hypothetical protein
MATKIKNTSAKSHKHHLSQPNYPLKYHSSNSHEDDPSKTLNKSNCNLNEFPIIKLHILQNLQYINLANNQISNFDNLKLHNRTAPHVLRHLICLDLSQNLISHT